MLFQSGLAHAHFSLNLTKEQLLCEQGGTENLYRMSEQHIK